MMMSCYILLYICVFQDEIPFCFGHAPSFSDQTFNMPLFGSVFTASHPPTISKTLPFSGPEPEAQRQAHCFSPLHWLTSIVVICFLKKICKNSRRVRPYWNISGLDFHLPSFKSNICLIRVTKKADMLLVRSLWLQLLPAVLTDWPCSATFLFPGGRTLQILTGRWIIPTYPNKTEDSQMSADFYCCYFWQVI